METRSCQNCKQNFSIEPDDFSFYQKMQVPPPTFCPDCRRQRRLGWRNYINFYKRTCALTNVPVISIYAPDSGMTTYLPKVWHSDAWDPFQYGQEYDFSKPFFAQYAELLKKVPKPALDTDDGLLSTNCEYTNDFGISKDCYLVFKAWKLENVMYTFYAVSGKDLCDVHTSFGKDEGNYETVNTKQCYQCRYVYDSQSCSDSAFCFDCRNCDHCFMSTGLRGKSYCYKNEEVGKARYEELMREYKLNTNTGVERAKKEFEPLMRDHPRKALRMVNCNDCVGDLIFNSHDCKQCFIVLDSEHYKFGNYSDGTKDSYDADANGGSELIYESDLTPFASRVIGSFSSWNSHDSYYISHTYRSKNCFGCSGLKDAQYCILNKQYSKEEYLALLPKILQQMKDMPYLDLAGRTYSLGDFPPIELSYIPYNDSAAQEIYPLSKEEVLRNNFYFHEPVLAEDISGAIAALELPDAIEEVSDDILTKIIVSRSSNKKYRITREELTFYRKYKIPLPRESFFERHAKRHKIATSYHLYNRKSDKSGEPIISSYPPGSPEKVWSIDEYKKEFE